MATQVSSAAAICTWTQEWLFGVQVSYSKSASRGPSRLEVVGRPGRRLEVWVAACVPAPARRPGAQSPSAVAVHRQLGLLSMDHAAGAWGSGGRQRLNCKLLVTLLYAAGSASFNLSQAFTTARLRKVWGPSNLKSRLEVGTVAGRRGVQVHRRVSRAAEAGAVQAVGSGRRELNCQVICRASSASFNPKCHSLPAAGARGFEAGWPARAQLQVTGGIYTAGLASFKFNPPCTCPRLEVGTVAGGISPRQ